jgi:hypothetical protein
LTFKLGYAHLYNPLRKTASVLNRPIAAGVLQKLGLLSYRPGKLTILDRPGLESTSCECYDIIREFFDHSLDAEEGNVGNV